MDRIARNAVACSPTEERKASVTEQDEATALVEQHGVHSISYLKDRIFFALESLDEVEAIRLDGVLRIVEKILGRAEDSTTDAPPVNPVACSSRNKLVADELELWRCAHLVLATQGADAAVFVAARIGELLLSGDDAGVTTWKAIAARMTRLDRPEGRIQ